MQPGGLDEPVITLFGNYRPLVKTSDMSTQTDPCFEPKKKSTPNRKGPNES